MAMVVAAATVIMAGVPVLAQTTANFAGKWTLVPDANTPQGGRGGGFGGGLGAEATVVQDAKTLTVTRMGPQGEIKSVYNLDGSDSKNTLSFGDQSFEQVSKVKADGAKLVITTKSDFGGNAFETTMTLSIDGAGNLVVDSLRPDFQGGGAPIATKLTYKKN
jgi:hypothetical protein